jgi:uncharacterized protein (DUF4415 family)
MKKQCTEKMVSYHASQLPKDTKTDWKRVDAMTQRELNRNAHSDVDAVLADPTFWKTARHIVPSAMGKERITIRIDEDVLHWLKDQGRGYQSRINALLRAYMGATNQLAQHHSH